MFCSRTRKISFEREQRARRRLKPARSGGVFWTHAKGNCITSPLTGMNSANDSAATKHELGRSTKTNRDGMDQRRPEAFRDPKQTGCRTRRSFDLHGSPIAVGRLETETEGDRTSAAARHR